MGSKPIIKLKADAPTEVVAEVPKLNCNSCGKEVESSEFPKCAACVKADAPIPRPPFPGHAGTADDPDGAKFAAWLKADMAWKQHPKREL